MPDAAIHDHRPRRSRLLTRMGDREKRTSKFPSASEGSGLSATLTERRRGEVAFPHLCRGRAQNRGVAVERAAGSRASWSQERNIQGLHPGLDLDRETAGVEACVAFGDQTRAIGHLAARLRNILAAYHPNRRRPRDCAVIRLEGPEAKRAVAVDFSLGSRPCC